jgi:hypothetical protein
VTRHRGRRPTLTAEQILAWSDAHHARTGKWPSADAGPIPEAPGLTWRGVQSALSGGARGLPGGDSLARLLDRHRPGRVAGAARRRSQPWTPEEDELVRTLPPAEAARRTGRSLAAVYQRRHVLGVPDGRLRRG